MQTLTAEAYFSDRALRAFPLFDVRSPGEHTEGRLPGAISLPLFDDAERAEVGTLYKRTGPDAALLRGLDIAGRKMRWLVEQARRSAGNRKEVIVHCWRGGQRSASVAWLLERAGFKVHQLTGGYKAARKYIRTYLANSPHELRVLSGPTGSGKTAILLAMRSLGANIVDLEGLANHKGSSFGAIGQAPQPSTEQFENLLYEALREIPPAATVWLEDESRMIGCVYQPDEFYDRLIAAPVIPIQQPTEWRVDRLVTDYGTAPPRELREAFTRIRKRLGGQHLNTALEALDRGDLATAARVALVYYDKAYAHYADRRGAGTPKGVDLPSADPTEAASYLLATAG